MDSEWPAYEVFIQARRGDWHTHVGAVHAPDAEMALLLAKENFARRGGCVSLWVVPAGQIQRVTAEEAETLFNPSEDKSFREASGYRIMDKIRKLREGERPGRMKDEG